MVLLLSCFLNWRGIGREHLPRSRPDARTKRSSTPSRRCASRRSGGSTTPTAQSPSLRAGSSCRRSPPPPRPPRKKNTRTEAFASRARARSWNNWFRKKPGLVLFPSTFLLRGSRGKFSFPLPFSLTLQTATRRLLTTHPYSSDFPFVVWFALVPRRPRHGKFLYLPRWSTGKQKKTLWHQARRS